MKISLQILLQICFTIIIINLPISLYGQSYCSTPAITKNIRVNNELKQLAPNLEKYCLRVYFHVILTDGPGNQTPATVAQAYQILNEDFAPYNISFFWDGGIDYIDGGGQIDDVPILEFPDTSIYSVNNNEDGIDIYLYSDSNVAGGRANGIGESSEFWVSGSMFGQSLITSNVISHEMGHVLFLWHTHHGTAEDGNDNPCPELVNGSNSTVCGDYIADTPADPFLNFDVNPTTCFWNQSGNVFDANGDPYNPDEHLIMSYSRPSCMEYFSPMQGLRMRNAIETLPFLQETLMNCEYCGMDTEPDLIIKDSNEDEGVEPNVISENTWTSNDIWVRIDNDNGTEHQNPEYNQGNSNYVYVRLTNKNCYTYPAGGQLEVYWTKANLSSSWPDSWNGTETINGFPKGNLVGTLNLPEILAGEELILPIEWDDMPDPEDYDGVGEPWHFCLLVRINSAVDPMAYIETADVGYNVVYNNNIASKNVNIIKVNDVNQSGGTVAVYNPYNNSETFDIVFAADDREAGKKIFEEAEVYVKLSSELYAAWLAGGSQSNKIVQTGSLNTLKITGDNAQLKNISMSSKKTMLMALKFNFLTAESTSKTEFTYHVSQRKSSNQVVLGGNTYVIQKPQRSLFDASANDITANRNQMVTLEVDEINEDAVYNWYDEKGNLIYTGTSLTVIADISKTYKVEIIADEDGFKDYADVVVSLNPHQLTNISPNPSSSNITVNYNLNSPSSAYISIVGYVGNDTGVQRNYILNTESSQTNIDVSNYATGYYTVALICDGEIVGTINLIKQ